MALRWSQLLDQLAKEPIGGYHSSGPAAAEPTAWSALALAAGQRWDAARRAGDWLRELQQPEGAVAVTADQTTPAWPTSLALLTWQSLAHQEPTRYTNAIARGVEWALSAKGKPAERSDDIGHDSTLIGWSWAADTHSWLEPTAMFVAALRAVGHGHTPRVREGVNILVDRLLPTGGCNYGNTYVLGQPLRPHPQPTGIVLWALAGESLTDPRIERSKRYLQQELEHPLGAPSVCHAVLGLSAQGENSIVMRNALERLAKPTSTYEVALLARAWQAVEGLV